MQLFVGRGFFLISGFATSAILSRTLGPASFGVYGVVISVLAWFERVLSGGIPGATALLIPRYDRRSDPVEQGARLLLSVWVLPLFVILWFAAPAIAGLIDIPHGTALLRVAALDLPAMSWMYAAEGILNGRRNFQAQGSLQVMQSAAKLLGVLTLLAIGVTVKGALIAHVAGTVVAVSIITYLFPPNRTRPTREILRSMLGFALPSSIYLISLPALLNMSLWQLKASQAGAVAAVGFFVASLNLTRILQLVPATVSGVLFSSLSWAIAHADRSLVQRHVRDAGRLALGVLTAAWVLLAVDSSSVMSLLFGREYAGGGGILTILTLAFAFSALSDVWLVGLSADGKIKISAMWALGLLPVVFLANRLLIPLAGAEGAAAGSACVFGLGAAIAAILVYRNYKALLDPRSTARILGCGAVVWVVGDLLPPAGPWVLLKLAALGLLYLGLLRACGEITKDDLVLIPVIGVKLRDAV